MPHPDRLTVVDEIFLRTHRGYGTPIALQGLWRTADRVDRDLLEAVHSALRTGPLGRRVVRAAVPGARRRWQSNTRAHPLDYGEREIPVADLLDWAETTGHDLDPEFGPGWRLAAVPLDDGGSVVSLTCSHALADGRALVIAVDDALCRTVHSESRPRRPAPDSADSRHPPNHLAPTSDWTDARRQWATVLGGTARAVLGEIMRGFHSARALLGTLRTPTVHTTRSNSRTPPDLRTGPAPHSTPDARTAPGTRTVPSGRTTSDTRSPAPTVLPMDRPPSRPPSTRIGLSAHDHANCAAVVRIPIEAWDRAARERGGTPNSLFIWTVARILWEAGFPEPTIEASLPVDTRAEPRVDNDLSMTLVTLTPADTPATIRDKARAAYEYRMSSPGGLPEELLQVIPDRWAATLAAGAGERDILCSNIGPLPPSLETLGPHHCTGVAARAIHPALTTLPRTRLSGYLCTIGTHHTLSLTALDPTHFPTTPDLQQHLKSVTTTLNLPTHTW